jgi:alkanesulfonate monooxygenase
VHIISGGNDAEQRRDGDYLDHDQRYARTDAFLDVVRQVGDTKPGRWASRY